MFTKGQKVFYVSSWDDKGTYAITPALVLSCGKKQMTLEHAVTGQNLDMLFSPTIQQTRSIHGVHDVVLDCSEEVVEYFAILMGEQLLSKVHNYYRNVLANAVEGSAYEKAMLAQAAEIKDASPSTIKR